MICSLFCVLKHQSLTFTPMKTVKDDIYNNFFFILYIKDSIFSNRDLTKYPMCTHSYDII